MKKNLKKLTVKIKEIITIRKVGLLIVFLVFFFVGVLFRNVVFDIGAKDEVAESTEKPLQIENEANDESDISYAKAAATMDLEIDMPEEMKEKINYETFYKALESYLVKEDFWADVTVAASDYIYVEDLRTGEIVLTFELNDYYDTNVVVTVERDGSYVFSHY